MILSERLAPAGALAIFENQIGRLLTVGELAELLRCSQGTIRNWVSHRLIPVVRPSPRMVRFSAAQISQWLSERNDPYGQ